MGTCLPCVKWDAFSVTQHAAQACFLAYWQDTVALARGKGFCWPLPQAVDRCWASFEGCCVIVAQHAHSTYTMRYVASILPVAVLVQVAFSRTTRVETAKQPGAL